MSNKIYTKTLRLDENSNKRLSKLSSLLNLNTATRTFEFLLNDYPEKLHEIETLKSLSAQLQLENKNLRSIVSQLKKAQTQLMKYPV